MSVALTAQLEQAGCRNSHSEWPMQREQDGLNGSKEERTLPLLSVIISRHP